MTDLCLPAIDPAYMGYLRVELEKARQARSLVTYFFRFQFWSLAILYF
jgi:hypothetical protein